MLVLGIGNVLWADEGFGVRAVEALHASYAFPDGGRRCSTAARRASTCSTPIASARRVLVFDAIDFGLPPGTLRVLRDGEVPAWGAHEDEPAPDRLQRRPRARAIARRVARGDRR